MKVTVAICTWNRAALLDQTLERMKCLQIPEGVTWELLVVNNNCTDNTDEIIQKHSQALPLKRLFEPKQGHSNARNCAVEHASGELIVWTDDDVLVNNNWILEYLRAAATYPTIPFFGGTVHPWFETTPPQWLVRSWPQLRDFYAIRELGPDLRPLATGEEVFGANMMFRTKVLRDYPFDPKRGHQKTQTIGGDETDVIRRMRLDGHDGVWVGSAIVEHFIPVTRMTRKFLWDYVRMMPTPVPDAVSTDVPTWGGVPRWLWRQYLENRIKSILSIIIKDNNWSIYYLRAAGLLGRIEGYRNRLPKLLEQVNSQTANAMTNLSEVTSKGE